MSAIRASVDDSFCAFPGWVRHRTATHALIAITLGWALLSANQVYSAEKATAPNIIFILADDLGYGDLGCYGQEKIRTPSADRLARQGVRFTQHYSGNAVCAPSRCVLMTGLHPGHAYVRDNRQVGNGPRDGSQQPLPSETVTLPKLLKQQGYVTGAFGKWGLGAVGNSGAPSLLGIDRFFGYHCQAVAHNHYPPFLWDNDKVITTKNSDFSAHQQFPEGADPKDSHSYDRYRGVEYSSDLMAEQAREFIRKHKDGPFFLYFPTIVPHLALQVPEDSLQEYAGKWPDEPHTANEYLPHLTPRAAYAAMITRMDREVGRMIDLVEELGLTDNTIFVLTSDNGPLWDRYGGTDTAFFQSKRNLRGFKGSLFEGGVRVPGIISWKGKIASGQVSDRVTGFEDWLPTLMELVGAKNSIPAGLDGVSFAPTLRGESQEQRPLLYREFPGYGGQQFVRVGDWKLIRQNLHPRQSAGVAASKSELYNLAQDISESNDLAETHPDIVEKLSQILKENHTPSSIFPIRVLDDLAK